MVASLFFAQNAFCVLLRVLYQRASPGLSAYGARAPSLGADCRTQVRTGSRSDGRRVLLSLLSS